MGKLKPLKGNVSINPNLRIGHFTQHSGDNFDLSLSALENLLNMFEDAEDQPMRSFLGKFQIQGNGTSITSKVVEIYNLHMSQSASLTLLWISQTVLSQ